MLRCFTTDTPVLEVGVLHMTDDQGDQLSGKPGNVGNLKHAREMSEILTVGKMLGKNLVMEKSKVSRNCSLLVEYLRSYGYLAASS